LKDNGQIVGFSNFREGICDIVTLDTKTWKTTVLRTESSEVTPIDSTRPEYAVAVGTKLNFFDVEGKAIGSMKAPLFHERFLGTSENIICNNEKLDRKSLKVSTFDGWIYSKDRSVKAKLDNSIPQIRERGAEGLILITKNSVKEKTKEGEVILLNVKQIDHTIYAPAGSENAFTVVEPNGTIHVFQHLERESK
jgi:hypothetical protein